jgi:glycosyltransferase involved in cell wall biosynthesis
MASVAAVFRRNKVAPEAPPARDDITTPAPPSGPATPPVPSPENRPTLSRKLAGATILQILPSLRDEPTARAALNITAALLRSGARAIVAAEGGALVSQLQSVGAEWLRFRSPNVNLATAPWFIRRNGRRLEDLILAEHVDIIHTYGPGAAASARAAAMVQPVWFITTLPDQRLEPAQLGKRQIAELVHGHRVMAHSAYVAAPIVWHYHIPKDRLAVIAPPIDTAAYHPLTVTGDAVAKLRAAWQIQADELVVLAPGDISSDSGHSLLVDAARILAGRGAHNIVFVVPGTPRSKRRDFSEITKRAKQQGVDELFCLGSSAGDDATLLAAADVVVMPALAPVADGTLAVKAQAMGKPVIAAEIGVLPECVLAPPRMPEDLRTGWLFRPNDPIGLARAIMDALSLDEQEAHALAVRAWQFAQSSFSSNGVAADTLAVYTSLLDNGS